MLKFSQTVKYHDSCNFLDLHISVKNGIIQTALYRKPIDIPPSLLPQISSILAKHHNTMVFSNPDLKNIFPEPRMAAIRQGPNLRK